MNSAPSGLEGLDLPSSMFEAAFPFFLHWDSDLRICSAGPSLAKACPKARAGASIRELFRLIRPVGELGPELFRQDGSKLFLMEAIESGMKLRGQVFALGNGSGFLMLATPWIADPDEIERLGLTLGDFAVHDQTMDLLQVVQTHRMAIDDLTQLNNKLTEQRAQLRAQRADARKLALVAARTHDAVVVTDSQGLIEWTNEGFTRTTGWTLEEVIGKKPGEFLQGPETDPATVQIIREHISRGEGVSVELLNYSKTGRKYWLSIEIQPMHSDAGELIGYMAVERDITETKEADRQLRETAALRHAMLNDAGSAIIATDPDGIITLFNPAAERLLGYRAGELVGISDPSKFHEYREVVARSAELTAELGIPIPPGFETFVARARRGQVNQREWTYVRKDGTRLPVLLSVSAITHGDQLIGFLGVANDLSEQKKAEEKVRTTLSELDASHERITIERDRANKLAQEAEAANRAKSNFLATMSHEIRTPMNGVLGFVQLLQQTSLSEQQTDFINSIRSSAEALLHVINDVLDFSKIESGQMGVECHPFSLQRCVDEVLETVSTVAAAKGLDLAARLAPEVPPSVVGDSHRLRQVLVNLLGNAVKFTSEGEVRLEVEATPGNERDHLTFHVSDTGIGIHPGEIEKLFTPFHQEDSSTSRRFGGSGLGLAICRRLIELLGGTIEVSSTPGEGSRFSFSIPAEPSNDPPSLVSPLPFPDFVGQRGMVIDTHPWSRQVISELLENWGMAICTASSADEARMLADRDPPGLILADLAAVDTPAGEVLLRHLTLSGAAVFVICQPGEAVAQRKRFERSIRGTVTKPIRISPLFNTLVSSLPGAIHRRAPLEPIVDQPAEHTALSVLLVEDHPINRKLALTVLSQLGWHPDVAIDGQEAVDAATAKAYDVILMDVQMPGMDGLEATRRIRRWEQDHAKSPARIIAVTANALSGDREVCLQAGMDDYLSKPLRLQSLRDMLRKSRSTGDPAESSGSKRPKDSPSAAAIRQLAAELSPDDAISLARDFLEDLDGALSLIHEAVLLRNFEDARRHAHSLKGSSSIFSLDGLREAAAAVEHAFHEAAPEDPAEVLSCLSRAADRAATDLRNALASLAIHPVFHPMS